MVFKRRTYSARAAGRDLESLSPEEQAEAETWYRLTEERAITMGAPSNLGFVFAMRFIAFVLKFGQDGPNSAPSMVAVNMGYAARTVDVERRRDLSEWSAADIEELIAGAETGHIDLDAANDQGPRAENLVRWIVSRSDDPEAFFEIASCTPSLWGGLVSWAALNVHGNMSQHGARPRDLPPSTIDGLMRLGYVLRCLDEALGEEPGDPRSYSV
jgi:hypothetical protein